MKLPIIDPDEPWTLDEHAGKILHAWRHLKGKKGNSEHAIRLSTARLIEAYRQVNRLLPPVMYELLREIVEPPRRSSYGSIQPKTSGRYWAAVRFEAENPTATDYAIAKHICEITGQPEKQKQFEHQVEMWRQNDQFGQRVAEYRRVALVPPRRE